MISDAWLNGRRGQALAVAIGLIGIFILWFGAVDPIRGWFDDRQRLLEQRRDLLHHMQDLAASLPALRTRSADNRDDGAATEASTLPGATDPVAAADLQERVQAMAAAAGVNLTAVETLPATTEAGSETANSPTGTSVLHARRTRDAREPGRRRRAILDGH